MDTENPKAFKHWINSQVVEKYFQNTSLPKNKQKELILKIDSLELKQRVQLIADQLYHILPKDYKIALQNLLMITRKSDLKSFELWPATQFVQTYGVEDIDASLSAMYEWTQKFTAEFCIRPFINRHGLLIYSQLAKWIQDPNEHIRRWLSEGTRPKLPWGEKLTVAIKNPHLGLNILEHLKYDSSLYVRKSVSNHLNDISKDHPELVVKTLKRWKKTIPPHYHKEFEFICNRGLRTLIKQSHPLALSFLNIKTYGLHIQKFKLESKNIKMNQRLNFSVQVENKTNKPINFIIDYIIYFQKANGQLSPKVFKFKKGLLRPKEVKLFSKQHLFKYITTRKFYFGRQQIAIQFNGQISPKLSFHLEGIS